ncbi:permease-like cell division protein FtsX [Enterococcus nangangensis]|uniref:permease-like cell division protein FtsX n=1 Tax=Enterococcus nangangensis TaxID=2559926 RepID=UPI0010F767E1|nr:permease-like cell division protein FtsX [Enterococcus nangangensis]
MIRTFFRHIWESIKSLKRNGWMTFASVFAVTITLLLVGVFLGVILNVTKLAEDIANNVNVTVYVETNTDEAGVDQVEKDLENLDHVTSVAFSSKDEQLANLTSAYGDSFNLFEGDANPLRDAYIVEADKPENVKKVQEAAEKITNVEKADYGGDFSDKVFSIAQGVRTWGVGGSIVLLLVAIFLISNTIRITIMTRKREIQIMRLVGAKNGYIRWPFFFEGAWIGVLGSVVPILVTIFGYRKIFGQFNRELIKLGYSLMTPDEMVPQVIILMVVVGVLIGSLGSVLSMRRFLKI